MLFDVLRGLCPSCRKAKITRGIFGMHRRCPACDYDLHPESGYFLGAMVVAFLATAILTVPVLVALKLSGASVAVLVSYPLVQYAVLGPVLLYYARVLWLHVEYGVTNRLNRRS